MENNELTGGDDHGRYASLPRRREVQSKLRTQISREHLLAEYEKADEDCKRILGCACGFSRTFREEIEPIMQPGDELWKYDSTQEEWEEMRGERGVALVRNGSVISILLEVMN